MAARRGVEAVPAAPLASRGLAILWAHGAGQTLLDQALDFMEVTLERNNATIVRQVSQKTWRWMPKWVDDMIAAKVVNGLDAAIAHIERYGSHHTDSIVTEDAKHAERFLREVDSAIVLHNASTQFADGGEFGFGAEIGIATGKLHARGPVGVQQLTSFKYRVHGDGQIRP